MAFQEWELVSYDVWGNEEDGFNVNAAYRTGKTIQFDSDISDKDLVELVSEWAGYPVGLDVNSCDPDQIVFLDKTDGFFWKPAFELQRRGA